MEIDRLYWGRESNFVCFCLPVIMWFLFGFLYLWVLGMGYVILLWHSLSLPYNYFDPFQDDENLSDQTPTEQDPMCVGITQVNSKLPLSSNTNSPDNMKRNTPMQYTAIFLTVKVSIFR